MYLLNPSNPAPPQKKEQKSQNFQGNDNHNVCERVQQMAYPCRPSVGCFSWTLKTSLTCWYVALLPRFFYSPNFHLSLQAIVSKMDTRKWHFKLPIFSKTNFWYITTIPFFLYKENFGDILCFVLNVRNGGKKFISPEQFNRQIIVHVPWINVNCMSASWKVFCSLIFVTVVNKVNYRPWWIDLK